MLGTGIASAQENVNPDAAPSAIDGGVTVPLDMEKSAIGQQAGGQREAGADQTGRANPLVRDPGAWADTAPTQPQFANPAPVDSDAIAAVASSAATNSTANAADADGSGTPGGDSALSDNLVGAPLALPLDSGDVISTVGNAAVEHGSEAVVDAADGDGSPLLGKAIPADGAISGDVARVPANLPGQAFGLVTGAVGKQVGQDSNVTLPSNIVTAPVIVAGHAVSDAATLASDPNTDPTLVAGGPSNTIGNHSFTPDTAVQVPTGSPEQAFGRTLAAVDNGSSDVDSTLDAAGEDAILDAFGNAVGAGDVTSTGIPLSGAAQATAPVQDLANPAAAPTAVDTTPGSSPFTTTNALAPVGALGLAYDIPVAVLSEATAVLHPSTQTTGEDADAARATEAHRGIDLPASIDKLLGATEIPNLTNLTRLPVAPEALSTLPVNQLPAADQLGALDLPTQGLHLPISDLSLPTDELGLPEERSFGGTLPLTGGNFGVTPNIQNLRPLAPATTGRSLPALPVAPITTPRLPISPIAPIAHPRALPTLPTTSLTGLQLDAPHATNGERSLPAAPALAGLDTKSIFGNLEDTIQIPRI
ncbi:hypothetical protein [Umezawaea sp. Da 62-37]|uniref:hypothetical protein n=1 Tax=Umezawaea sp. Da 62-37 TaxID=3075927 RepID=UPI0028F7332F|nr:hypothetical protein [Umezawaea sp. Da 62-37]WNV91379.1 hypothetical protein RM788_24880 [Umezawaea sp. Da 62-37]